MKDANNTCKVCDASCVSGSCTLGNSNVSCTACANSNMFLNPNNTCVSSSACITGSTKLVAVFAADSTSRINKCETSCPSLKGLSIFIIIYIIFFIF